MTGNIDNTRQAATTRTTIRRLPSASHHLRKTALVLMILFITGAVSCGDFLDKEKTAGDEKGVGASVELVWPEGFDYDSSSGRLDAPSGAKGRAAPAYVSAIKLTISGPDMETMTLDIPLDTLRATVTVSFGERRFEVLVQTNTNTSFTGSVTTIIGPGITPVIRIPLEINAPPVIESMNATAGPLNIGETAAVKASFYDMDPDDVIDWSWTVTDSKGQPVSFDETSDGTSPVTSEITLVIAGGGDLKATLTVTDNHGAKSVKTVVIDVVNRPPVITNIGVDKQFVKIGDMINLKCDAVDPDNDPLTISWFSPSGWSATGSPVNHIFQGNGDTKYGCKVDDGAGGFDQAQVLVNSGQNPRTGAACSSDFNVSDVGIGLSWSATADLDIAVTDPNGKKIWYGNLRPGGGAELCVDVSCANAPGVELAFWKMGSNPPTGTYTVQVRYHKDCTNSNASIPFSLSFEGRYGYLFNSIKIGNTELLASPPVATFTDPSVPINPGQTITYTFDLI